MELYLSDDALAALENPVEGSAGVVAARAAAALCWHLRQRDGERALHWANTAIRLLEGADLVPSERWVIEARLDLACAEVAVLRGQDQRAARLLDRARAGFLRRDDLVGCGDVLMVEAISHLEAARCSEAAGAYAKAASIFGEGGEVLRWQLAEAHAIAALATGDPDGTAARLVRLRKRTPGPRAPALIALMLASEAVLAYEIDARTGALAALQASILAARQGMIHLAVDRTTLAAGHLREVGDLGGAGRCYRWALERAMCAGWGPMEQRLLPHCVGLLQAGDLDGVDLREWEDGMVPRPSIPSMGRLPPVVAHEMKNPTNFAHAGAQGLAADLERFRTFLLDLAGADADAAVLQSLNSRVDQLAGQVGTVIEGTSRVKSLLHDLSMLPGQPGHAFEAARLAPGLLATVGLVRTRYTGRVDIQCDLQADPLIECAPSQLNQVFMNLIVNACQALEGMPPGQGRLSIRSVIVDDSLVLSFRDNGCGIPEPVRARIFEPFFSTKPVDAGAGLGLSITRSIVEAHGGDINVVSAPGEGSCFSVRLPLRRKGSADVLR